MGGFRARVRGSELDCVSTGHMSVWIQIEGVGYGSGFGSALSLWESRVGFGILGLRLQGFTVDDINPALP